MALTWPRMCQAVALWWLLGTSLSMAQSGLGSLQRFSESVSSMSATFIQQTQDGDGQVLDQGQGEFFFRKPQQFRWSYDAPFAEVIVGDGQTLWHFDPNLDQVTVRPQPTGSESPIMALTNWGLLTKAFRLEPGAVPEEVILWPRQSQSGILRAWVVMEQDRPQSIGWADQFSQVTLIEFDEIAINPALDDGLFVFKPPPGVDVLEGL